GEERIVRAQISADSGVTAEARASLAEAETYPAADGDLDFRGREQQLRGEMSTDLGARSRELALAKAAYDRTGSYRAELLGDPAQTTLNFSFWLFHFHVYVSLPSQTYVLIVFVCIGCSHIAIILCIII